MLSQKLRRRTCFELTRWGKPCRTFHILGLKLYTIDRSVDLGTGRSPMQYDGPPASTAVWKW